ncbi:histidine phosphatase family protein [Simiduia sp. 21SJ11W-1]|uniref:histidine phosphatase family protein n=1 Tax=Simiduia sp. 21SJ11W-1 TaxID=2909669 RepID=UPI00209EF5C0|nr:histidine phosphatase family protein [Simiduia sp. 21SJ11W-1]UTA47682.1 histidine phosphatase family protein [Simiduia sp. 21SJ11W-1]
MQPTSIYLLRHGACTGGQIFRGRTDSPCTPEGFSQMRATLDSLPALDGVISSPLVRCAAPAQDFARARGISCTLESAFAEIDFGTWEGRLVAEVEAESPSAIAAFWRDPVHHAPPAAETLPDFRARVAGAWQALLTQWAGKQVVLVTHGGVIRMILAELLAMPLRPLSHLHVPHASLSLIRNFHAPDQPDWPQLIFHNGRAGDDH